MAADALSQDNEDNVMMKIQTFSEFVALFTPTMIMMIIIAITWKRSYLQKLSRPGMLDRRILIAICAVISGLQTYATYLDVKEINPPIIFYLGMSVFFHLSLSALVYYIIRSIEKKKRIK